MAEKIQLHDFIELDYTGQLIDGTIFDTTSEKVAKEHHIYDPKTKFGSATICVGERQLLPGLDQQLVGQEIGPEHRFTLDPEQAFGKRDIKRMKLMPASAFKQHQMNPYPGLQIDVDGEIGTVAKISGGRILVNFNHPLAGKSVIYIVKVHRKITAPQEQIVSFLETTFRIPENQIKVEVQNDTATVELPQKLPEQFADLIGKKLSQLVKLKEIQFKAKESSVEKKLPEPKN